MAKLTIKQFQLGQLIGMGTVGSIYRARDWANQRDVAQLVLLWLCPRADIFENHFGTTGRDN